MENKIQEVKLENYGAIDKFQCNHFSNINLIIGENGTGKTFLLKALYSAVRSMEEYRRGDDIKTISEVLSEKLRWTFQVDWLGDMVSKTAENELYFEVSVGSNKITYQFSQEVSSKIEAVVIPDAGKTGNSIFIPAKEVLSLFSVILKRYNDLFILLKALYLSIFSMLSLSIYSILEFSVCLYEV